MWGYGHFRQGSEEGLTKQVREEDMQTRGEEPSRQRARCQTSNAADVSGDQQGGK